MHGRIAYHEKPVIVLFFFHMNKRLICPLVLITKTKLQSVCPKTINGFKTFLAPDILVINNKICA